jgi:alkanesulfonate monooxygenase SsuD/methylene tetrahydromethanopterin reductase-like flavin-dependent oxidoreductase (luciferase family)
MILDIFSELQRSGDPSDDAAGSLYRDAIEQAKLADEMGFGCWWQVEHHGAPTFSFSSAPDMFLTVLSQHTERMHLGHSGVLAPYAINSPLRVAERAAFLDIMSGGRLELGLARSVPTEWATFNVDPDITKAQVNELLVMLPKMWSKGTFEWESETFSMPPRDVTPKPIQRPHPPLWLTSGSPDGFEACGRMGVGVLGTVMLSPMEHLAELCQAHQKGLAECNPVSSVRNEQVAVFAFMHCRETEQEVIDSGAAEAAIWFMNAQADVFGVVREVWLNTLRSKLPLWHTQGANINAEVGAHQEIGDLDDPEPLIRLMNRQMAGLPIDPVEAYEVLLPIDAVLIGDVDTCRRKLRAYEATGVDRVMCLMQVGPLPQEAVLESLRTTGKHLIPALASGASA